MFQTILFLLSVSGVRDNKPVKHGLKKENRGVFLELRSENEKRS